jgi:transcription antitermination factor NusA-like protein
LAARLTGWKIDIKSKNSLEESMGVSFEDLDGSVVDSEEAFSWGADDED